MPWRWPDSRSWRARSSVPRRSWRRSCTLRSARSSARPLWPSAPSWSATRSRSSSSWLMAASLVVAAMSSRVMRGLTQSAAAWSRAWRDLARSPGEAWPRWLSSTTRASTSSACVSTRPVRSTSSWAMMRLVSSLCLAAAICASSTRAWVVRSSRLASRSAIFCLSVSRVSAWLARASASLSRPSWSQKRAIPVSRVASGVPAAIASPSAVMRCSGTHASGTTWETGSRLSMVPSRVSTRRCPGMAAGRMRSGPLATSAGGLPQPASAAMATAASARAPGRTARGEAIMARARARRGAPRRAGRAARWRSMAARPRWWGRAGSRGRTRRRWRGRSASPPAGPRRCRDPAWSA